MISPDKIEEWVREAQERPSSGPLIIRFLANRLMELSNWNEELLSENIQLRSGEKVEKYESRIANLEYQLDLLKRQFSGEFPVESQETVSEPGGNPTNLILYNPLGKALRLEFDALGSYPLLGKFSNPAISFSDSSVRLLVVNPMEELLFVFDSGRTAKIPAQAIPASEPSGLSWEEAFLQEPRGVEELVAILPIARMSLFELCLQVTRRGYIKKIKESFFEAHLAKDYIGTGVTQKFDKTFDLTFCNTGDLLVLASREGYLSAIEVDRLPFTIEEVIRLGSSDHIVSMFIPGEKESILVMTNDGKAIHREASWLEPAASSSTKGKPVFSGRKREAGARVVAATAVDDMDWAVFLTTSGDLRLQRVSELLAAGSVEIENANKILSLAIVQKTGRE